jgi:hypothetical protein
MKTLREYIVESEYESENPIAGDNFAIELDDGTVVDTYVMEATHDSILLDSTPEILSVLEQWASLDIILSENIDEAEYHGKHVTLNKPTRGDVKKFKVYVKDPSTGNIKKVNFGHGGKTARRLGQKTMRIKKSNPARRRSFRARHHCENPGPKTKARYWSCRAW